MKLIVGSTEHIRYLPTPHRFRYPLYMVDIDIETLVEHDTSTTFFGYNRWNIFAIHDADYLMPTTDSLAAKIRLLLSQFSFVSLVHSVRLVTIPRFLFNTFKPVSFYLCYDKAKILVGMIAEVSNTYRETHYYQLEAMDQSTNGTRFVVDKNFHVSPFFDDDGQYHFRVDDRSDSFGIHIRYERQGATVFYANFTGKSYAPHPWRILKTVVTHPLTCAAVFPRILLQAAMLYWFKRLPAKSKPIPSQLGALRGMPLSWLSRQVLRRLTAVCNDRSIGRLDLTLPDGSIHTFGTEETGPSAKMHIRHNKFFKTILTGGEIGLGESFFQGEWDSEDPTAVIQYLIANKQALEAEFSGSFLKNVWNLIQHRQRKNTQHMSKKNIEAHYDLGNDFYGLFLDSSMMYSSGLFDTPSCTLENAQRRKVDRLLDELNLSESDHVLEIGSGWGFAAARIVERFKCKVTTITLSNEQYDHTLKKVQDLNLQDRVTILIQDYRNMTGTFDAILSIEMIEAVGETYLPEFFRVCHNCLKKGGRFALQAITYPNEYYNDYCRSSDFIRKHIFPGGHLPSLGRMASIIQSTTTLRQVASLNIAQSYARTLAIWRDHFSKKKDALIAMGFDLSFYRKWYYYFAYCDAAFRSDYLGCYQLTYVKGDTEC